MPLSLLAGEAWEKARDLLRKNYHGLVIVTIVGGGDKDNAFSADTGMSECLVIASKNAKVSDEKLPVRSEGRACFVVLVRRPGHHLEAVEIARAVQSTLDAGALRRIEDGPVGGSTIRIGEVVSGAMLEAPLPRTGPWPLSRIGDFSVAQTAHELVANCRLWLPGVAKPTVDIYIKRLGEFASAGPYHMDINGTERSGGAVRGPFNVVPRQAGRSPTYPILWAHSADHERKFIVEPDSEGELRADKNKTANGIIRERAAAIWATASSVHINRDFRFNSQSTAVTWTNDPCIGGRAWPSVVFRPGMEALSRAFVVWSNSTLGLLLYFWVANKQQAGRGSVTVSAIADLPTLDFERLYPKQLDAFDRIFEDMGSKELLPFNEIDKDPERHALDARILVDVLGINAALVKTNGPFDRFRRKLSQEPSIHGGK